MAACCCCCGALWGGGVRGAWRGWGAVFRAPLTCPVSLTPFSRLAYDDSMATLFPPAAADSGFHPTKLWPHHSAGGSPPHPRPPYTHLLRVTTERVGARGVWVRGWGCWPGSGLGVVECRHWRVEGSTSGLFCVLCVGGGCARHSPPCAVHGPEEAVHTLPQVSCERLGAGCAHSQRGTCTRCSLLCRQRSMHFL